MSTIISCRFHSAQWSSPKSFAIYAPLCLSPSRARTNNNRINAPKLPVLFLLRRWITSRVGWLLETSRKSLEDFVENYREILVYHAAPFVQLANKWKTIFILSLSFHSLLFHFFAPITFLFPYNRAFRDNRKPRLFEELVDRANFFYFSLSLA